MATSSLGLPVKENKKLTVKEYRNLIYEEIRVHYKEEEDRTGSMMKKYSSDRLKDSVVASMMKTKSKSNLRQ
jgi:hypothetical protein